MRSMFAMAAIGVVACATLSVADQTAAPETESATVGKATSPPIDPTSVSKSIDGKYLDKEGTPTFHIAADGTVDWFTYSGFRHYHSECHVCHGPYGEGSSYAPALKDSVKQMSYGEFLNVVATGRQNVSSSSENVMPAFGHNLNVACHLDDLYIYLRARAEDALGRVRPAKREDKPEVAKQEEASCMGNKG
uniref:C-type cytochrome, methanol metabolism-related n=1 Tax=Rhodopseudomonas palustris (strain BisA53) TaxID=316055 RepID=Q07TC6_RHOP5